MTLLLWDLPTDLPAPWPPEQELWLMLASAAGNDSGIPQAILDAKAEESANARKCRTPSRCASSTRPPACLHLCLGSCPNSSRLTTEISPNPTSLDFQLAFPCLSAARSVECRQQNTSQSYSRQGRASCCLSGSQPVNQ